MGRAEALLLPRFADVIALGVINLLNHSDTPNCMLENYVADRAIECWTTRPVKRGEELMFKYRCPLWFEPLS